MRRGVWKSTCAGRHGGLEESIALLRKPVTPEGLLHRVRAVLDELDVPQQAGGARAG